MHDKRQHSTSCSGSTEDVLSRWFERPGCGLDEIDCPACRDEASAIQHLDRILKSGLQSAAQQRPSLSAERLAQTLEQLRGEPSEIRVSRRLRRGMRVVLWSTLYAFLFLGASALFVALFRVVSARLLLE